jgi:hypothetical protein
MNTRISIPKKKLEFIKKLNLEYCSTEIYLQELKEFHLILDETLGLIQRKFFFFKGRNLLLKAISHFWKFPTYMRVEKEQSNFKAKEFNDI